jgi:hypothetical protein
MPRTHRGPLFWRQEPGVDLSVTSEADWQHGLRLYQAYDRDAGARDAEDTVDAVAKLPGCPGKVAVLGDCLGALMVFLTAVRHDVDAAVAYHGGGTEKYLEIGFVEQLLIKVDVRRSEVFFKAMQLGCALNRNDPRLLGKQPSKRELSRCHLPLFREKGQPMLGSAQVRDPKFQDRVVAEIRALLSTIQI